MKRMTETQRAQQIEMEMVIRDSFRQQQQALRDWIQLMSTMGMERAEIADMLSNYASMLDYVRREVDAGRPIR